MLCQLGYVLRARVHARARRAGAAARKPTGVTPREQESRRRNGWPEEEPAWSRPRPSRGVMRSSTGGWCSPGSAWSCSPPAAAAPEPTRTRTLPAATGPPAPTTSATTDVVDVTKGAAVVADRRFTDASINTFHSALDAKWLAAWADDRDGKGTADAVLAYDASTHRAHDHPQHRRPGVRPRHDPDRDVPHRARPHRARAEARSTSRHRSWAVCRSTSTPAAS